MSVGHGADPNFLTVSTLRHTGVSTITCAQGHYAMVPSHRSNLWPVNHKSVSMSYYRFSQTGYSWYDECFSLFIFHFLDLFVNFNQCCYTYLWEKKEVWFLSIKMRVFFVVFIVECHFLPNYCRNLSMKWIVIWFTQTAKFRHDMLFCRLGLEVKKEENLAEWYSQVWNHSVTIA